MVSHAAELVVHGFVNVGSRSVVHRGGCIEGVCRMEPLNGDRGALSAACRQLEPGHGHSNQWSECETYPISFRFGPPQSLKSSTRYSSNTRYGSSTRYSSSTRFQHSLQRFQSRCVAPTPWGGFFPSKMPFARLLEKAPKLRIPTEVTDESFHEPFQRNA